jgi:hypothetical protein
MDTQTPSNPSPEFRTGSLYLAALLIIRRDLKFVRAERQPGARSANFIFEDPKQIGSVYEMEFLDGDPQVPIKELRHALDKLRDRVRAAGLREVDHASLR